LTSPSAIEPSRPTNVVGQRCLTCGAVYPLDEIRWRCDFEGHEPLQITDALGLRPEDVETSTRSIWRYRNALRLPSDAAVSLGEGCTPIVQLTWEGRQVDAKLDYLNPTGSFKDRGVSVAVSHARHFGVTGVVEDSSGNAGASFSAYAAAAGLPCTIYAPAKTSAPKLNQIRLHGAKLNLVEGSRDMVADAARSCPQAEGTYVGHNWNPFFLEGCKTVAYEIWEGLGWAAPDAVVVPVGGGGNLLGLHIGFGELLRCGSISRMPRLFAVQAANCAPLAAAFTGFEFSNNPVPTMAEGIAIRRPPRLRQILEAVRSSKGTVIAVDESEILSALRHLLGRGIPIEPTSAAAFAGLSRLLLDGTFGRSERVVAVLTGSALKATAEIAERLGF
jgi:threonine synthase